jgi:membrane protein
MAGFIGNATGQAEKLFARANARTGGALGIVRDALQVFAQSRATEAAAGLAYYALFSLFPLLLLLVAVGSSVLETEAVVLQVTEYIGRLIPVSQDLIRSALEQVITPRGPVRIVGLVGLLWSATGFFAALAHNICRAWPESRPRNLLEQRLAALLIVALLMSLMLLSMVSGLVVALLPWVGQVLTTLGIRDVSRLWAGGSRVLSLLFSYLLFLGMYRWVPQARVTWRAALLGAGVTAVAWQLAAAGFGWYLASGLAGYHLVYGSLETVVVLMFWLYLSSWIALFGAHLTAAIGRSKLVPLHHEPPD